MENIPIIYPEQQKCRKTSFQLPRFKLSPKQVEKISDISADTAMLSLGVVVLPVILGEYEIGYLIVGIPLTLLLWTFSLILLNKI